MLNKLQNEWRSPIIFILLAVMMAALFVSRYLLSVSIIAFVICSFFHTRPGNQLRNFFSTPLLWGMSLLFVLPLLSGLWSDDKRQWLDILRIKLPLLVMPLAFAAPVVLSHKQWLRLAYLFIFLIAIATAWSMFHYSADITAVNESYLKAKTMITPLENDHVRFSWLVSVAVLLGGWICRKRTSKDILFWVLAAITIWLVIFLHILVARTGLFALYLVVFIGALWLFFKKAKFGEASVLLMLVVVLPLAAYSLFPSFRNRVKYIRYDFSYFKDAHYLPGSTDAVRVISWKMGWEVIRNHPLAGVGFGDMDEAVQKEYAIHYPSVLAEDRILPSSEWLIYGSACGWPGMIVFTIILLIPFFTATTNKMLWCLLNIMTAFGFLFDIGLETQFGVFVYSFILLWCWKWWKA